ncbi:MAG: hypothetical protein K1X74_03785 [Pirellulales bacterium]|nr:hypothetical protein [Pirellulales bacterium]
MTTTNAWKLGLVALLALCGTASLGCVRQAPAATEAAASSDEHDDYCPFCKKSHGPGEHGDHDAATCTDPNCKHCDHENCDHDHEHGDHEHGDHDHEHGDHDHEHGDHDHDHEHGDDHEHESK